MSDDIILLQRRRALARSRSLWPWSSPILSTMTTSLELFCRHHISPMIFREKSWQGFLTLISSSTEMHQIRQWQIPVSPRRPSKMEGNRLTKNQMSQNIPHISFSQSIRDRETDTRERIFERSKSFKRISKWCDREQKLSSSQLMRSTLTGRNRVPFKISHCGHNAKESSECAPISSSNSRSILKIIWETEIKSAKLRKQRPSFFTVETVMRDITSTKDSKSESSERATCIPSSAHPNTWVTKLLEFKIGTAKYVKHGTLSKLRSSGGSQDTDVPTKFKDSWTSDDENNNTQSVYRTI